MSLASPTPRSVGQAHTRARTPDFLIMASTHTPMCDGYDERMSAFAKAAHPTPDECIMVVMDLLQSVKAKRWEHKGGALNAVLRDYKRSPEPTPKKATESALAAILENSMNKATLRRLGEQCKRAGLYETLAIAMLSDEESSTDSGEEDKEHGDEEPDPVNPDLQSPALSTHSTVLLELVTGEFSHDPAGAIEAARNDLRTIRRQGRQWAVENLANINAILSSATGRKVKHKDPQAAKADLIRGLKKQLAKAQTEIRNDRDAAIARQHARSATAVSDRPAPEESPEFRKKQKMSPRLHRTGVMLPSEPKSPMPKGHYMHDDITDNPDIQTQAPKVVHPVSETHARACLEVYDDIQDCTKSNPPSIADLSERSLTRLSEWFCPPGVSLKSNLKHKAQKEAAWMEMRKATQILGMRARRHERATKLAQLGLDTSAAGMFPEFEGGLRAELELVRSLRQGLWVVEFGVQHISRIEQVSNLQRRAEHVGFDEQSRSYFAKIIKARTDKIIEEGMSAEKTKRNLKDKWPVCATCKKRHNPNRCFKKQKLEKQRRERQAAAAMNAAFATINAQQHNQTPQTAIQVTKPTTAKGKGQGRRKTAGTTNATANGQQPKKKTGAPNPPAAAPAAAAQFPGG